MRYHPWGGTHFTSGATPTTRRFTGQIEDAAIGLYFYNARSYDPSLGRFISPDSIIPSPQNPQALNRYSYVLNSPLRYVDPSGHIPEVIYNETLGYYVVKLDIQIYGPGASASLAEEWQKHLNDVWNNGETQFEGRPVTFDITVTYKDPEFSGWGKFINWLGFEGYVRPQSGDTPNLIFVDEGIPQYEPPKVRPHSENQEYDWGRWYSKMGNGYALHESVHLMGIYDDRYDNHNAAYPEYYGYISADALGTNVTKPCAGEVHEIISLAIDRGQFSTIKTQLPSP
ncbi:MAG TPA: RHS repeat-associated core domain-containing protein [Anaerolineae bacterium]|nr:RHS repeat-associated core domain-containing protein [Anaerolineae bacterium]HQK14019.1 RHS repeat-associated core domain-containing protein [Anaerolineae bacterium]